MFNFFGVQLILSNHPKFSIFLCVDVFRLSSAVCEVMVLMFLHSKKKHSYTLEFLVVSVELFICIAIVYFIIE